MATETTTARTDVENSKMPSRAYHIPAIILISGGLSILLFLLLF